MEKKKYQIFISSTYADLKQERQAIVRAVLDMNQIPAGMEFFPATDVEQLTYIYRIIDECDYYILIIKGRYGSTDGDGISFTEREYRYAKENGKFIIALIHNDIDATPVRYTDRDHGKLGKLEAFISEVSTNRIVRYWENLLELQYIAGVSLMQSFSQSPQIGWVRGDRAANEETLSEIVKIRNENDRLQAQINKMSVVDVPHYLDVADVNSELKIPYSYIPSSVSFGKISTMKVTTYAGFIKIVGMTLYNSATLSDTVLALKNSLRERDGVDGANLEIKETFVSDTLLHLLATGHVKMWSEKLEGGPDRTMFQLTGLGAKLWMESGYTRADKANAIND